MVPVVPQLGVGLQHNPEITGWFPFRDVAVDALEVLLDTLAGPLDSPYTVLPGKEAELGRLAGIAPLIAHSNYGAEFGFEPLEQTSAVRRHVPLARLTGSPWVADHCFYGDSSWVDIWSSPVQFSRAEVRRLAVRASELQDRYGIPLAHENAAYYAQCPGAEMSEARFMAALVEASGTYLHLDLHNVHTNAVNFERFDAGEYLRTIPLERVIEIHLAGGTWSRGWYHDWHQGRVPEPVWDMLEFVLQEARPGAVILEVQGRAHHADGRVLTPEEDLDGVYADLDRARAIWDHAFGPASRHTTRPQACAGAAVSLPSAVQAARPAAVLSGPALPNPALPGPALPGEAGQGAALSAGQVPPPDRAPGATAPARESPAPAAGPDAEITWHTWRRILRDDRLGEQVRAGTVRPADFGLDPSQARVAAGYAAQAEGSRWAIETYRYRVVSAALHALAAGAPVTLRLLRLAGLDLRDLAQAFAQDRDWADDGPFVYRTCAAFLRSIRDSAKCDHVTGLPDAVALELAVARLMTHCAVLPPGTWPIDDGRRELPAVPAASWYEQTGLGVVVTTTHRLTPWLTDRTQLGRAELIPEPENLLVHLPDLSQKYALSLLGADTAAVFRHLAAPRSHAALADLAPALDEDSLTTALASLTALAVIRPRPAPR